MEMVSKTESNRKTNTTGRDDTMVRRGWSLGYPNEVNVTTTFKMTGARLVAFDKTERPCAVWEGPEELLRGLEVALAQAPALADAIATACGLVMPVGAAATEPE